MTREQPQQSIPHRTAEDTGKMGKVAPRKQALERRIKSLTSYIENRVLVGFDVAKVLDPKERKDIEQHINALSQQEKVEALYQEIVVYSNLVRVLAQEKIPRSEMDPDPLLLARLSLLWADTSTRQAFLSRYAESREADRDVRLSAIGTEYRRLLQDHAELEARFEEIQRSLFTGTIKRIDRVQSAKQTASHLVKSIHAIETRLKDIAALKDLPATTENADLAASIMFDTIARYSDQAKSEQGFIWLPYFEDMLKRGVEGMQNGRWPMIIGESGTGKSEVAEAIIRRLSGDELSIVKVRCTPQIGEMQLVTKQEGLGVNSYGKLMEAATGYTRSDQTEPDCKIGRIVRLDEFLYLGEKAFALLKDARQLKPGSVYEDGKKVLPGFGGIGTSNPPGRRYHELRPMNAALEREFSVIPSDYPPMTNADPQLYEALLGALLDDSHHTDIHLKELSPSYQKDESEKGHILKEKTIDLITNKEKETVLGTIVSRDVLEDDPTNPEHGTLWRFSHFVRTIQDAYTLGNANPNDPIPANAVRYNTLPDGSMAFDQNGSEVLRLERATMTLEVKSWMTGWRDRKIKDSPAAHTKTFTEWLQYKLGQYIASLSDDEDREKIQALSKHFHLTDAPPRSRSHTPLTRLEIGRLSPRVPRAYVFEAVQTNTPAEEQGVPKERPPLKTYHTDVVVMEDEHEINLSRDPSTGFTFEKEGKQIQIRPGSTFVLDGKRLLFAGCVDEPGHALHNKLLVRPLDEALYHTVSKEDIIERAEEFDIVFIVTDAKNPYREALIEASIPDNAATAETKEITLNISEEIRRQCSVYMEVRDNDGKPLLKDWADDIANGEHLIAAEAAKDHAKIMERIKAGMIPTVMPSRAVQERTWETALTSLKPLWMTNKAQEAVNNAYLYDGYKNDTTKKMTREGFFKNIPDRPYLVWTVPGQKPNEETCEKTFDEQEAYYVTLVQQHPDLYDPTDLIPTEYIALQATFTHAIQERFKQEQGIDNEPTSIKPLDYNTYTRFLSSKAFSDGLVPYADFHPRSGYRQMSFGKGDSDADVGDGFRPAARL